MEDEDMNADDFYEEFKNSLAFLGLQWGHKELALVSIKGESIVFSYGTKSARICIGSKPLTEPKPCLDGPVPDLKPADDCGIRYVE